MATNRVIAESLARVRLRPRMYLGTQPLLAMALEVVGGCLDEHQEGRASSVSVDLVDGWLTVADDGSGLSVETSRSGSSFLELVFTTMDGRERSTRGMGARATRDKPAGFSTGGVGLGVVSALCQRLEVESHRDGRCHRAVFSRGVAVEPVEFVGKTRSSELKLRLLPDPTIFGAERFEPNHLQLALRRLAYIYPRVVWDFCGQNLSKPDGLLEYLADAARGPLVPGSMGSFKRRIHEAEVVFAVALRTRRRRTAHPIASWANRDFTTEGGSHVDGMRAGVEAAFGDGFRSLASRIVGAIHVVVGEPMFEGQTRGRLVTPTLEPIVRDVVASELSKESDLRITWLEALSRLDP